MINSRYKIGDTVIVRSDLREGRIYGRMAFVTSMIPYIGKIVTIRDVHPTSTEDGYSYYIEGNGCHWTNQMLEGKRSVKKLTTEELTYAVNTSESFLDLVR